MDIKVYKNKIMNEIVSKKCISEYGDGTLIGDGKVETFEFGLYPIKDENGKEKELVRWMILSKNENNALLISKDILIRKPYHNMVEKTIWEKCDLRQWLNSEFYNECFNDLEKEIICDIELENAKDKVSLLSIMGAKKYFLSSDIRIAYGTDFAMRDFDNDILYKECRVPNDGITPYYVSELSYWLRAGIAESLTTPIIDYYGDIREEGFDITDYNCGVRPIIKINFKI